MIMPNPEQRKIAEEIYSKLIDTAQLAHPPIEKQKEILAAALSSEAQRVAEECLAAVEGCGISVWTTGEPSDIVKAELKGHEAMRKVKEDALRSVVDKYRAKP